MPDIFFVDCHQRPRRSHPVSTIMALTGLAEDFEEADGYGVISLLGAAAGAKKFTCPISDSLGVIVGSLHGQVQIMKPPEEEADQILNYTSGTFTNSAESIRKGSKGSKGLRMGSSWSPRDNDDDSVVPSCCLNVKTMHLV